MSTAHGTIRPMNASDIDRVVEIADSLAEVPRWARETYESALHPASAPRRIVLVIELAESAPIVGFAVASLVLPEAELETIGVAAEWQRRGQRSQLLGEMERILRGLGVTKVTLEVRASNASAQCLYRSHGFSEIGRRQSYYSDPKEDALVFGREFSRP